MILKRQLYHTREVDYFGMQIIIPKSTRYLTTDSDGAVIAWHDKPYYNGSGVWFPSDPYDVRTTVAKVLLDGTHPKNTLAKV